MNIQGLVFIPSETIFSRPALKNLYTYKNTNEIGSINSPYVMYVCTYVMYTCTHVKYVSTYTCNGCVYVHM